MGKNSKSNRKHWGIKVINKSFVFCQLCYWIVHLCFFSLLLILCFCRCCLNRTHNFFTLLLTKLVFVFVIVPRWLPRNWAYQLRPLYSKTYVIFNFSKSKPRAIFKKFNAVLKLRIFTCFF